MFFPLAWILGAIRREVAEVSAAEAEVDLTTTNDEEAVEENVGRVENDLRGRKTETGMRGRAVAEAVCRGWTFITQERPHQQRPLQHPQAVKAEAIAVAAADEAAGSAMIEAETGIGGDKATAARGRGHRPGGISEEANRRRGKRRRTTRRRMRVNNSRTEDKRLLLNK